MFKDKNMGPIILEKDWIFTEKSTIFFEKTSVQMRKMYVLV